jgi:hypothetical protein
VIFGIDFKDQVIILVAADEVQITGCIGGEGVTVDERHGARCSLTIRMYRIVLI